MTTEAQEFEEIAHSGGKVVITVVEQDDGRRQYQLEWTHCRPTAAGVFAVYALPQGVIVGNCAMRGIGAPIDPPPVEGSWLVLIGSDSEGRYGHECPACGGYWRSGGAPAMCPYCSLRAPSYQFLTQAQRQYVSKYVELMADALELPPGEHTIDLDAVADAVGSADKPPFYYTEERQQKRFNCSACGSFNDVLGHFVYCSSCGTRNDLDELKASIGVLRAQANDGGKLESIAREAVSAFDSFCGQYMRQLVRIPMTSRRADRLKRMLFHNLKKTAEEFLSVYDIDVLKGLSQGDVAFAEIMFHRRHVYEHKGGEVDEKYIQESGDTTVRLKQALRENKESVHRLLDIISRMASNLHQGFHEIRPPIAERIARYKSVA